MVVIFRTQTGSLCYRKETFSIRNGIRKSARDKYNDSFVGASCARDLPHAIAIFLMPSHIYIAKMDNPAQPLPILLSTGYDNNIR